ncbi:MAG: hypothetical protein ACOYKM_07675 [Caulobacterales bacterium]
MITAGEAAAAIVCTCALALALWAAPIATQAIIHAAGLLAFLAIIAMRLMAAAASLPPAPNPSGTGRDQSPSTPFCARSTKRPPSPQT